MICLCCGRAVKYFTNRFRLYGLHDTCFEGCTLEEVRMYKRIKEGLV